MKKIFNLGILLSVLGFCVSCSRYESPMDDPEEPVRYVTLSMKVDIDTTNNVSTKTSMDASSGVVKWSNDDEVTIYFQDMNVSSHQVLGSVSNISSDGKSATFSYSVPAGDSSKAYSSAKYVCYGNQNITVDGSNKPISISLPSVQRYAGDKCFEERENVSIGYLGGGYYDFKKQVYVYPDTTCVMKNLFGILKVNVTLDNPNKNIDYIQLTDNTSGNYLAGEFEFTELPSSNPSNVPKIRHKSGSGGESLSIIKKVTGTVNGGDFYFLVPPGTLFGTDGFNLYIYTKDGLYAGKKVKPKSAKASIDRSMVTNVTLGTFVNKEIPVITNPNTANSYIVPAVAGPYSIPAQYKGNGYQGNRNTQFNTATGTFGPGSYSISNAASAEIVWQGRCNGETILDGEVVSDAIYFTKNGKGYIGFHRSGVEGNALVAVKDASNNILWSWHLWVTSRADSTQISNGKVLVNQQNPSESVVTIMDRNLGALSADPSAGSQSHGLAYQFGRKDPYMGSRFSVDPTGTITEYASFATIYPALAIYCYDEGSTISLNRSISYPYERSFPSLGNWCSDNVYWGDPNGDRTKSSPKTLYDPCPAGWRTFEEVYLAQVLGRDSVKIARPDGEVVSSVDGLAFKLNNNNNPVYFPGSGSSTSTLQVTHVGKNVSIWGSNFFSSGTGATHSQAYILQINMSKQGTGTDSYTSDTPVEKMRTTMPVRCQRWTEPGSNSNPSVSGAPSLVRSAECQEEEELEVVYID